MSEERKTVNVRLPDPEELVQRLGAALARVENSVRAMHAEDDAQHPEAGEILDTVLHAQHSMILTLMTIVASQQRRVMTPPLSVMRGARGVQ